MGVPNQSRYVERQQFFEGQRLFADDLQELEAFHREMRELHNKSLHQPGIGAGLAVSGSPGDREVVVGPGYALDVEGREIVLSTDHTQSIPPVQGAADGTPAVYDLAVSYPEDERLEVAETRAGVCLPRGAVRLREKPIFCWVRLGDDGGGDLRPEDPGPSEDIATGRRILLARARIQHCKLTSLSIAERLNARPPSQPLIACGRAEPDWEVILVPMGIAGDASRDWLLLEAGIETADAGFVNTPCYTARVDGPRAVHVVVPVDEGENDELDVLVEGVVSVHDATPEGFSLSVFVLVLAGEAVDRQTLGEQLKEAWIVEWMGVD